MRGDDHTSPNNRQGRSAHQRLARLRARIARIEAGGGNDDETPARRVALGVGDIDRHLPGGGLGRGAVHEVIGGDGSAAALGFALWAVSRFAPNRPWLWCVPGEDRDTASPYAPALEDFGLSPRRLLLVQAAFAREVLWAAEEGLATPVLGAVLAEARSVAPVAARRLALAARGSGVPLILLRPEGSEGTLAATRWRVSAAPGDAWEITLTRAGGAFPRRWRVVWRGPEGARPLPVDRPHGIPDDLPHPDIENFPAGAGLVAGASARGAA